MKKKCFRWLSGFLVAVLLIPLFATTALAVSKIVLQDGSAAPATVLVGRTYALKVSDNTKVIFYSSNESVAKVGQTTAVLEPVAPGKVAITAKDAKTDEVVATRTFTVLQRATAVSAGAETLYLSQGDRYTLKPTLTPTTSTDVLRFISDDKSIATVGQISGTVTAKALGETTITIYAKEQATKYNADPENRTTTVRVVVGEKPQKAEVVDAKQIKLTFLEDIPDGVTAEHFSVTQANTMGVSKTLGIESAVQNSSRELLLTMAEPVFSETETSTATLYFTSPDDENHIIIVNLGKKYADTSEPTSVTKSGNTRIEAGTSSFLQFWGADKDGASYPLDNVTVNLYSYVTNNWTVLPETGTVVDKVSFRYKLLGDGSLMVIYTASPDAAAGTTFAIQLKKENGKSFPATSLLINSATQNAKYSLRFVSAEGEELFEPLALSAGTSCTTPVPVREGYTFKEWKRSDGETDIIPGRVKMPEYDLTLTAVWEYTPSELTASVSADGWTYGSPVSPTLNNSPADASKVTYQYKAVGADDEEWNKAEPTTPGNYQVRAVIETTEGNTITTAVVFFAIRQKAVTITGTAVAPSKPYDGNTSAEITDNGTLDGVVDGDDVFIIPGTAAYDDENVGAGKEVTFTGFALGGTDKDNYVLAAQPDPVTADITDPAAAISVDIAWDSMEFTYAAPSKGTWNPETHNYENAAEGGWTTDGGHITVTNNGNTGVAAHFSFTPAEGMNEISGAFTASSLTVDAGKADSTTLTLSGAPSAEFESGQLGAVNVSINKYGWMSQDGKTYYYDDNGTMVTGWLENDGKRYCFDQNGVMCTGWMKTNDGKWYWFDQDGVMHTGWLDTGGREWYYFDPDTGIMRTGWLEFGGQRYYFAESTEGMVIGVMWTGWLLMDGKWFYFNESTERELIGAMRTGWLWLDGIWRYFDRDTGVMCTGWAEIEGTRRYFDETTGGMCTGWVEIDGTWYYFDETGQMMKSSTEAPNE